MWKGHLVVVIGNDWLLDATIDQADKPELSILPLKINVEYERSSHSIQVLPTVWDGIPSNKHSTVWNGDETLFDLNFQAMGISPDECFSLAFKRQLRPGKYMRVCFASL
jgi:hypothetical protein